MAAITVYKVAAHFRTATLFRKSVVAANLFDEVRQHVIVVVTLPHLHRKIRLNVINGVIRNVC